MKLFASVVSQLSGLAGGDDLFPNTPFYYLFRLPPAERRIGCACMNLYRIVPFWIATAP
jgi:hypothetical protein